MPAINWAFLCDYASIDASGKAYIIGTFEYIRVPSLPRRWPQIYVAMEIQTGSSETFELSAVICSPSGKEISKKIIIPFKSTDFGNKVKKGFATFTFFNTNFTEEGEHHIQLYLNDTFIHNIPLTIRVRPKLNKPPAPPQSK